MRQPARIGLAVGRLAAAALAIAVMAPATADAASRQDAAPATPSGLPVVNMEAVVKAAQIDPRRADHTYTDGAKASVLLVEKALQAKHLLAAKWVDGYFGTQTVTAYAAYQRSLGYSGLAANGLPGAASLTKLGADRYTVTRAISAGPKVTMDGKTVDSRTRAMLLRAQQLLHRDLTLTQGSYSTSDSSSAGTHAGGGAVDISVSGMSTATKTSVVRVLREVGFAAWSRTPSQGDWPNHIHAVAISDTDLSAPAQHQVGDYYLGYNGLANHARDDGPRVKPLRTWEEYLRTH